MKSALSELKKSGTVQLPNGGKLTRDGKGATFEASQKIKVAVKLDAVEKIAGDPPMVVLLETLMGLEYAQFAPLVEGLTPREREVFSKMGQGIKNRLIAEELGISTKTLDIHRANIGRKLGLKHLNSFGRAYWFFRLCQEFSSAK